LGSSFDFPFYLSVMLQTGIDITQPGGDTQQQKQQQPFRKKEENESGEN
jgi:hypothetical protein